jgi:regulatory protein
MPENNLYKTALNKAMVQCSRRELCKYDIRIRLEEWGIKSADIEKIINELVKENFINDERFASAFVRDKFTYNKWGKVKIASHLKAKQISGDILIKALNSIDNEVYIKFINELISIRRKSVKSKNKYDLKAKLLRYGLSKGFESQLLYDILNESEE